VEAVRVKVLHVYSGNLFGGVEAMLLAVARVPAQDTGVDHEFALCFDERLASELRALGRPVHLLGPVRLSRPATALASRQLLASVLRSRGIDRVVCHAPWSLAIFGTTVKRSAIPLVFWAHDVMTGRHVLERLARRVRPDLVICNSAFTERSRHLLFGGVESVVIHPPVTVRPPARQRRHLRMSLDTPDQAVVIVQASRCEPWKGHSLLLEALARIGEIPGWMWWQVGGPQRRTEATFLDSLRARAERLSLSGRIRWLGQRCDVPTLLAASDIHCQANLRPEPFGIAFVEALGAGLPIVSADHGGAAEIVDDTCGLLVPPGDPDYLADALRSLIVDADRRKQLGQGGPARARALCDPHTQVRRLADALDRLRPLEMAG